MQRCVRPAVRRRGEPAEDHGHRHSSLLERPAFAHQVSRGHLRIHFKIQWGVVLDRGANLRLVFEGEEKGLGSTGTLACAVFESVVWSSSPRSTQNRTGKSACAT